jgi:beta-glucosidase
VSDHAFNPPPAPTDAETGADPDPDSADDRPWWGTAAAATQCEGAAPRSDWAGWEAEGFVPASRDGNGFRTRYADDAALLAEHGIRHHRITVEWARLAPSEARWDVDEVAHVRRVLTAFQDAGVAPWACLLHGTAPGWFTDDERGWLDSGAVLRWARHVDRVAEEIGDLVAGWVPIHEPRATARAGYGDGAFPPGRHDEADDHDARAALLAAEAEAARLLGSGPAPVAVAARPGDHHDGDGLVVVAAPVDGLQRALEQVQDAAPHAEVLVVTGDPSGDASDDPSGGSARGSQPTDDRGAGGGRPEAGSEARRSERLSRAVEVVAGAHRGGLPVIGAFHQPAVDGYEWHRGFAPHLGLFDRDRNPRAAAAVLRHPSPT